MLKRIFLFWGWLGLRPSILLLLVALLWMVDCIPAQAEWSDIPLNASPSSASPAQSSKVEVPETIDTNMIEQGVQTDPLASPHPIPWNWVLNTQAELSRKDSPGLSYYRSQSLVSPDGKYAAYSRIQMQGQPEVYRSRVTSVMFVENLLTGDLRTITPSSPLTDQPLVTDQEANLPGTIAILMPVSWSESGERVLARQFEGIFSTSDASDFAVIWDRQQNSVTTVAPERVDYTNAVLLGWSQANPEQVIFRAGILGDENWPMLAVAPNGQTALALEEKPIIYGQFVNQVWTGPQARW
ncbi:MAG: hypothetical protein WA919_08255 [Coleofasciculaceae cyanobacterium]